MQAPLGGNPRPGMHVTTTRSFLLLAFLLFPCLHATAAEGSVAGWKLVSDRDGIQVYMRRDNETSRLKTFRGVSTVQLADQYVLAAILNDYASYPLWLHFVDSATEIGRESPLLRYLRFTTRLPWPLSDRDAVLEARVVQTHPAPMAQVTVYLDGHPDLIPPEKGYVRFPEMRGVFSMRTLGKPDQIEVTYELTLDVGGYIPIWLSNILLRDAPYFTLLRLHQLLKDPKYHGKYYDYLDLVGPGRPASTTGQTHATP